MSLETIIRENTGWICRYFCARIRDRETAEDLTQEVWLRVVRNWDGYRDTGTLRAWLVTIARNVFYNYLAKWSGCCTVSLDTSEEDGDPLSACLTDGITAEDTVLEKALAEELTAALTTLPEKQRQVLTCRYLRDMSVLQVAEALDMAPGTVRSNTHYGLASLRKVMGVSEKKKGDLVMDCRNVRERLFVYAAGLGDETWRRETAAHLAACPLCRGMAEALGNLLPQMLPVDEGCVNHWLVEFPQARMGYVFVGRPVPEWEKMNRQLADWGHVVPEEADWFRTYFSAGTEWGALYDNDGQTVNCVYQPSEAWPGLFLRRLTRMERVYPFQRLYNTIFYGEDQASGITELGNGRYQGKMRNHMGRPVKTALYQMLPREARDIQIEEGCGILDCGSYLAVYTGRYAGEDGKIRLQYSYTL